MAPQAEPITSTSDSDIIGTGSRRIQTLRSSGVSDGNILGRGWTQALPSPQSWSIASTIDERDMLGRRWASASLSHQQARMQQDEEAASTTDGADIIGRSRLPVVDRFDEKKVLQSRWAATPRTGAFYQTTAVPAAAANTASTTSDTAPGSSNAVAPPTNPPRSTLRAIDLDRIKRLIDRLSWKSNLLRCSQSVALSSPDPHPTSTTAAPTTMFKLDFYEYYVILERVIVLLLRFFGITVPSGGNGGIWGHSYHENVLTALAKPTNPLHEVLGKGPVMGFLRVAKNFRNRWKDADEQVDAAWAGQREDIVELKLDEMVEELLAALEKAYRMAEGKEGGGGGSNCPVAAGTGVAGTGASVEGVMNGNGAGALYGAEAADGYHYMDTDMEDAPWEAVEDAMDYEVL